MSLKNQKANNKKRLVILIAVGLVLALSAVMGFVFRNDIRLFVANVIVDNEEDSGPRFVFDDAKFSDWASFGSVQYEADETGDDQPLATISVSQCVKGSGCADLVDKCRERVNKSNRACSDLEEYTTDGCMAFAYLMSGSVDPEVAKANQLKKWSGFGNTPSEVGVAPLHMNTPEGEKEYKLYQYDTNNSGPYKRGSAFGFVPLSDSRIEVQSVCWQPSQLDDTLPALQAIRLEP